jgi:hypothetical protein
MPQFGASPTDDSRVIICICNMLIIQATDVVLVILVLVALNNATHIGLVLFVRVLPRVVRASISSAATVTGTSFRSVPMSSTSHTI